MKNLKMNMKTKYNNKEAKKLKKIIVKYKLSYKEKRIQAKKE